MSEELSLDERRLKFCPFCASSNVTVKRAGDNTVLFQCNTCWNQLLIEVYEVYELQPRKGFLQWYKRVPNKKSEVK